MIKLKKSPKPDYLVKNETRLTKDYKSDLEEKETNKAKKVRSVWNKEPIKKTLLVDSYAKCAYCESRVSIRSSYMEVEHFYPKDAYPEKVVDWDNLLPSCKKCNILKGEHANRNGKEIINPFDDDPSEHLLFRYNKFHPNNGSVLGERTREVLDLDGDHRREGRAELVIYTENLLSSLIALKDSYKLRNKIIAILKVIQPSEEYSAILATVVHMSPDYNRVRQELIGVQMWIDELEDLHKKSYGLILDKPPQSLKC